MLEHTFGAQRSGEQSPLGASVPLDDALRILMNSLSKPENKSAAEVKVGGRIWIFLYGSGKTSGVLTKNGVVGVESKRSKQRNRPKNR